MTTPIFKSKRKRNFIKTVTGKEFNPLNILPEYIDIRDICHVLSRMYIFGGHSKLGYSLAENAVNTHDSLLESYSNVLEIAEKVIPKDSFKRMQEIPLKTIRWLCLLQHSPEAYLSSLAMSEFKREVHYYRIMTSILKSLDIYHKYYKDGLMFVSIAEELLLRSYEDSIFHNKNSHLSEIESQKSWGMLYKRLSKDEVLFKSDGRINYV